MQASVDIVVGYSVAPKNPQEKKKNATISPYTHDLVDVNFIVPSLEKAVVYRSAGRGKESGKLSVGCAAANFIRKHTHDVGKEPRFVGFDVKDFLTFVGFECSLSQVYVPPKLWLQPEHITDLSFIYEGHSATTALTYFSEAFSEDDLVAYTELVKGWVPQKDADRDANLSFMFGSLFWLWGNP